jgi:hypothetical protein
VLGGETGPTVRGLMACAGIRVARSTRGLQSHPDEESRKKPARAHSLTYMPPYWPGLLEPMAAIDAVLTSLHARRVVYHIY